MSARTVSAAVGPTATPSVADVADEDGETVARPKPFDDGGDEQARARAPDGHDDLHSRQTMAVERRPISEPDVFTKTVSEQMPVRPPSADRPPAQPPLVDDGPDVLTKTVADAPAYRDDGEPDVFTKTVADARAVDSAAVDPYGATMGVPSVAAGSSDAMPPAASPPQGGPGSYPAAAIESLEHSVDGYPAPGDGPPMSQARPMASPPPADASSVKAAWREAHPSARKWAQKRKRSRISPRPGQVALGLLTLGVSIYLLLVFFPGRGPLTAVDREMIRQGASESSWRFSDDLFLAANVVAGLIAVHGLVVILRGALYRPVAVGVKKSSVEGIVLGATFAVLAIALALIVALGSAL